MDEIVKEFNTYFINIGRTLSDQIHSTHSRLDYLPHDKKTSSFVFNPVSDECIANVITNFFFFERKKIYYKINK